jgi:hypothetical protein
MPAFSTARVRQTASPRSRPRRRRAALTVVLTAALVLLICSSAAAYKPGQLIWAKSTGSSSASTEGWAAASGPGGAAAVAGTQYQAPIGTQAWAAAYRASGALRWSHLVAGGPGYAEDAVFDKAGNLYVAGSVDYGGGGGYDMFLVKYSPAGAVLWTRNYAGPAGLTDYTEDLALDGSGNAVVVGTSGYDALRAGVVVVKYKPNGDPAWAPQRFDPNLADPLSGSDIAAEMTLDGSGNIYVAGQSEYDSVSYALTLKFSGASGVRQWGQVYSGTGTDGADLEDVAVRGGRVVVVGEALPSTPGADALAISYTTAGVQKAARRWTGSTDGSWFGDVAIDGKGNVYVTGGVWKLGAWDEAITMRWNAALSKIGWKGVYLPPSKDAEGYYLALDSLNNTYVTGYAVDAKNIDRLLTMKYSPAGKRLWLKTWLPAGSDDVSADDVQLGMSGTILVAASADAPGYSRGALLKYRR